MISDFTLRHGMHIHLVGIGGSGISAVARVLLGKGFVVSGSDMQANELTAVLAAAGATIYQGHRAENIAGADALFISSAVPASNPEVVAARELGIPVLRRAEFLGQLMADHIGIAVAGSHGKTTTTGMIAQILLQADLDPTVIVGGTLPSMESNGRYGEGDYFVIEADEYDHMFLGLRPEVAVITSVEHDHPDLFPTEADYLGAFREFVGLLPDGGRLIACADDAGVQTMLRDLPLTGVEITTYALDAGDTAVSANFLALDCRPNQLGGMDFVVQEDGQLIGLARLRVPGEHNVRNALAAIIVGLDLGVDFATIRQALAEFGGMGRRFQVVGEVGGVTVIDDYAHHPTEIQATLAAARQRFPGRRLWAVWQPHTYSRTRLLLEQFAKSFDQADRVIALDIYRSREQDTLGMDTAVVLQAMNHPHAIHIPDRRAAADYLLDRVRPDDVILTLGAGDGDVVGQWVLEGLRLKVRG
jgi:UDP-N-acetylmuramate--alanine ligase